MEWYETINRLRVEIAFGIVFFSILFFQIQQAEMKTIMSMLLITLWIVAGWFYLQYKNKQIDTQEKKEIKVVEDQHEKRLKTPEIATTNYYVKSANKKGLTYLKKNDTLLTICKDLIFVKTFDEQKYQDLLIYMNHFQKVYMYILAERYPCKSYVPTFVDLRQNILEVMYQFYIVIPKTFKHIYGVNPYEVIEKNIHLFLKLSRTMLQVLENFCRLDLKEFYFPETNPMPFDKKQNPHLLP